MEECDIYCIATGMDVTFDRTYGLPIMAGPKNKLHRGENVID